MINHEISIIAYKKYRKYAKKNKKWRENIPGYLSADITIGSEKRTVFREHRSSKKSPLKLLGLRPGGGGGILNKVLYGEAPPRGPTPYPFIYHFGRKGTPFIYLLLKKGTPFTYLF